MGDIGSHPVWVRGLKHNKTNVGVIGNTSHPVWVRGLKPSVIMRVESHAIVAPRVGAWIETRGRGDIYLRAPASHPVWVRGLKLISLSAVHFLCRRTPCGCVD